MGRGFFVTLLVCLSVAANAISRYPTLREYDHVRAAKINKGLAIGTGAAGAGLLLGTGTYHLVQNAYWDDHEADVVFQHNSKVMSDMEFDRQMQDIRKERSELRSDMHRNYFICGGLFIASIGFALNAQRHSMKIGEETSLFLSPGGAGVVYRF